MKFILAALALIALMAGPAHADSTVAPERAPPSLLEPAKPLMDAYSEGLKACYGWPTSAGVFWCRVDLLIERWRDRR
jgi:hypothetical protein